MKQRMLAALLLVTVLLGSLGISVANAQSGNCGVDLTWVLDAEGTLTISGSGKMYNSMVTQPPWYDQRAEIKRVVIEDGVTSIGACSFFECVNLTDITVADSVTSIGGYAFDACESLTDVYYTGTKEQWEKINIDYDDENYIGYPNSNEKIKELSIHYGKSNYGQQDEITVIVNGTKVQFDVQPQIINDRTMVPLRAIFEALGATVEWNQAEQRVLATKWYVPTQGYISAEFVIGRNYMRNSFGNGYYELDSPPIIMDGRTLIPARAAAEAFNYNVEWDGDSRIVSIYE